MLTDKAFRKACDSTPIIRPDMIWDFLMISAREEQMRHHDLMIREIDLIKCGRI